MTAAYRRPLRHRAISDEQQERRDTLLTALRTYRPVTPEQAARNRAELLAATAPDRCRNGHIRTRTTTRLDARGTRQCRVCERIRTQTGGPV